MVAFFSCRSAGPRVAFALAFGFVALSWVLFPAGPLLSGVLSPSAIVGPARVVDGDTLDVAGQRIRLEGIDAPEAGQRCPGRYGGGVLGPWRCGVAATNALHEIVASQEVACEAREVDKYGRMVATCFLDGRDINAEMVRRGYAWAFVKYSATYIDEEAEARAARAGIWASRQQPQPPWVYRAGRWASAEQVAPSGCAIKGNISADGERIYHPPWSPWYDKVRISASDGERWFCDEAEAVAAGWRSVRAR